MKKIVDLILSLFKRGSEPKAPELVIRTSQAGIDLIKRFEGFMPKAYRDAVGVLTIGYGDTGPHIKPHDVITQAEGERRLAARLAGEFEPGVLKALTRKPSQREFDAMVSLAYNIGVGAFTGSTLVKKFNAGDVQGAANEFLRWNKAGGKVLKGLEIRREAERAMFLGVNDA